MKTAAILALILALAFLAPAAQARGGMGGRAGGSHASGGGFPNTVKPRRGYGFGYGYGRRRGFGGYYGGGGGYYGGPVDSLGVPMYNPHSQGAFAHNVNPSLPDSAFVKEYSWPTAQAQTGVASGIQNNARSVAHRGTTLQ